MLNFHEQLIEEFYAGFAAHDPETMLSCYHEEIVFSDPVFGTLQGDDVAAMWRMLIERSKGLEVEFSNIRAANGKGEALWTAKYHYSKSDRQVVNTVAATFEFRDDLIIRHTDSFNVYQWTKHALGMKGLLFGWSPIMHKKIQKQAIMSLRKYQSVK